MTAQLKPSEFQARVMLVPEKFDLFLGGGRGGGKSYALALLALRHLEEHGQAARVLYVRRSYRALADFELLTRDIFATVYGQSASYNASEHVWRVPGGGYMELAQLDGPADYSKFQGRSFTLLLADEVGEYPSPADLDRLRSNLRAPSGVPVRTVLAGNPGGSGHSWLCKRYVFKSAPWQPFVEDASGRQWLNCPSTYRDNSAFDQQQYETQLRASTPSDPELLRAWLDGSWQIARGAFFGSVIDEARNAVDPWPSIPSRSHGWRAYLAHDFGSSAPSATLVCVESPGATGPDGRWYPPGSIVIVDELVTADPDNPAQGMGYTVPRLAEEIRNMCERWRIRPDGVADDACFAAHGHQAGSIGEEFRKSGVYFTRARKGDRIVGWQRMRRLLEDGGKLDRPGLYITRNCEGWWSTVPFLPRDPRRAEDVDTRSNDHVADATRYACLRQEPILITGIGSAM